MKAALILTRSFVVELFELLFKSGWEKFGVIHGVFVVRCIHTLTVWSCDVEVGNVNYPHQEKPLAREGKQERKRRVKLYNFHSICKQNINPQQFLLVVEGLDEFGAGGDESFGWSQE